MRIVLGGDGCYFGFIMRDSVGWGVRGMVFGVSYWEVSGGQGVVERVTGGGLGWGATCIRLLKFGPNRPLTRSSRRVVTRTVIGARISTALARTIT